MVSENLPTTVTGGHAENREPSPGRFLSDSKAVQSLDSLVQSISQNSQFEAENETPVAPIFGCQCFLVRGAKTWWMVELPFTSVEVEGMNSKRAPFESTAGCDIFLRDHHFWLAVPIDDRPTVAELLKRWGEPPQRIVDDWRNQWERIASKWELVTRHSITTNHIAVDPSGNLMCIVSFLPSQFVETATNRLPQTSMQAIQAQVVSNSSMTSTRNEEGFENWLTARAPTRPLSEINLNERHEATVRNEGQTGNSAPRSSQKKSTGTNIGRRKQASRIGKPLASKRSSTPRIILGISLVLFIAATVFVWRITTRTQTKMIANSENPVGNPTSIFHTLENATSKTIPQAIKEAEAEIDYTGLENLTDTPSVLSGLSTNNQPELQSRMDSFFASLGSGQTIPIDTENEIEVPSLDDIVRGSFSATYVVNSKETDAHADTSTFADVESEANSREGLAESASESSSGNRIETTRLDQAIKRIQLRSEFGPVTRNSIGRVCVKPIAGWKIEPDSIELSGRTEQRIEISKDKVPGKIAILVQSTPGRIWRFQFTVLYASESIPNGVAVDVAGASQLFQRLVRYQTWLNQQLGNMRQARDGTADTHSRRILLENIKKLETELASVLRAVEEWRSAESWITEFYDQHQLEIAIASSREQLPLSPPPDELP